MGVFDDTMTGLDVRARPVASPAGAPLALGALALAVLTASLVGIEAFGPGLIAGTLVPYVFVGALVRTRFEMAMLPRFGPANAITLLRAILNVFILGLLIETLVGERAAMTAWLIAGLAVVSLALDGVDGHLARRSRTSSAFGARFDVEVDALLLVVLALAAVIFAKAGPWVLLLGAAHHLFRLAQRLRPSLAAPLPPSFRRKTIFVVQAASLVLVVLPAVPPSLATPIAGAALAAMICSFTVDIHWLERRRAQPAARA